MTTSEFNVYLNQVETITNELLNKFQVVTKEAVQTVYTLNFKQQMSSYILDLCLEHLVNLKQLYIKLFVYMRSDNVLTITELDCKLADLNNYINSLKIMTEQHFQDLALVEDIIDILVKEIRYFNLDLVNLAFKNKAQKELPESQLTSAIDFVVSRKDLKENYITGTTSGILDMRAKLLNTNKVDYSTLFIPTTATEEESLSFIQQVLKLHNNKFTPLKITS